MLWRFLRSHLCDLSCIAGWRGSSAQVIPNAEGGQTQPSCVAFTPYQRLFGHAALKQVCICIAAAMSRLPELSIR